MKIFVKVEKVEKKFQEFSLKRKKIYDYIICYERYYSIKVTI